MSGRRNRLDAELVRRGLARSREQAVELVSAGRVRVAGAPARKPATQVEAGAPIVVSPAAESGAVPYVSRGAGKLAGALDHFGCSADGRPLRAAAMTVNGRRCLDAGASTGGFTEVLLRRGAEHVVAVDVGYGQLAWTLRTDPRVTVLERTNVRSLTVEQVGHAVGLVVADLSFISLRTVLPALAECAAPNADLLLMVKPQFEVGRERLGSGGVVRDPHLRKSAVRDVAAAAAARGLGTVGVVASSLPGPAGNVEYFLWLKAGASPLEEAALDHAVEGGPQ